MAEDSAAEDFASPLEDDGAAGADDVADADASAEDLLDVTACDADGFADPAEDCSEDAGPEVADDLPCSALDLPAGVDDTAPA